MVKKYIFLISMLIAFALPAHALDLFQMLDPEGKSKDIQRAKEILEGATNVVSGSSELSYDTEFSIGQGLALEGFSRYGLPIKDDELQTYVSLVGNSIARNCDRNDITFYFVVVDSDIYNAFACPGGIIFVTSALVKGMTDESELAGVLAHEIAHVVHKHAVKTIQRSQLLDGLVKLSTINSSKEKKDKFKGVVDNLKDILFEKGLDQEMEFEADASGLDYSYRTGYDPNGLVRVLNMLRTMQDSSESSGSWFSTHPPLTDRISKVSQLFSRYPFAKSQATVKNRFELYLERF